jgi:hypothetical protein
MDRRLFFSLSSIICFSYLESLTIFDWLSAEKILAADNLKPKLNETCKILSCYGYITFIDLVKFPFTKAEQEEEQYKDIPLLIREIFRTKVWDVKSGILC